MSCYECIQYCFNLRDSSTHKILYHRLEIKKKIRYIIIIRFSTHLASLHSLVLAFKLFIDLSNVIKNTITKYNLYSLTFYIITYDLQSPHHSHTTVLYQCIFHLSFNSVMGRMSVLLVINIRKNVLFSFMTFPEVVVTKFLWDFILSYVSLH
jgi:hypothetical protein